MPKILISGESSFIGRSFNRFSAHKDVRFVSLRNARMESIDFSGIDVVIHLAAIVHMSNNIYPGEYFAVNRDLTLNFAEHARRAKVKHFIFMSTTKVYGKYKDGEIWNEASECKPTDLYGISKYEAEKALKELNSESFIVSIIRTPVVYGPGNKANMLKLFKLVKYFPVIPLGKTLNKRYFNYIENLISFIDRIIDTCSPGVFISMDIGPVSTTELIHYIADSLGKNVTLVNLPSFIKLALSSLFPRKYEQLFGSCLFDNSITRKKLDFNPIFTTMEGIKRTLTIEP